MKTKRTYKNKVRTFRGIPVQEAKADIHVQPNKADIADAEKESPTNCAYARCLKRTLEAANVFVFRSIAYIQSLNEFGEPVMLRYKVKSYAREYIMRFDSGEKVAPGGFVFHRPNKAMTLAYKQKQQAKRAAEGKASPRVSRGQKPKQRKFSLREGRGRVHLFGEADQIRVPY